VAEAAIRTEGLTKDYGSVRALAGLDLEVRPGEVYGFLGPNGAGKTTTIRLLLDLIRPSSGRAEVLGLDPRRDGVALRRRIGYLAGDFLVDLRQTGGELLTYLGNLRGGVTPARILDLAARLDLDLSRPIKALSRGNRQKIGVIQAFMHEPELLILDEPTSGLDPFLQQEFATLARRATAEGRTVFMSSHVMSEVQAIADRVGVIRQGRLVAVERVEDLRERSMRKVEIRFAGAAPTDQVARLPGVTEVTVDDAVLRCRVDGHADEFIKAVARHPVVSFTAEELDLEEIFFHYYDQRPEDEGAA
jgi:ABC-2 type transport system ATP-binding protein